MAGFYRNSNCRYSGYAGGAYLPLTLGPVHLGGWRGSPPVTRYRRCRRPGSSLRSSGGASASMSSSSRRTRTAATCCGSRRRCRFEASLERTWCGPKCTIGTLYADGKAECFTLEDPVRPNGEKVEGDTAIPEGIYGVVITPSKRFKRDCRSCRTCRASRASGSIQATRRRTRGLHPRRRGEDARRRDAFARSVRAAVPEDQGIPWRWRESHHRSDRVTK
jgi:hypothetical protein